MREIKFKAVMQRHDGTMYVSEAYGIDSGLSYLFDFENNRWDVFIERVTTEQRFLKLFPDDDEHLKGWCHIENIQYTGQKDKNDAEIYNGDIVKVQHYLDRRKYIYGVVRFKDGSFIVDVEDMESLLCIEKDIEIVGNKYENKELINANNKTTKTD